MKELADDDFRNPGAFHQAGTLFVSQPVVSATCDLELHFHHHPNKRALERP